MPRYELHHICPLSDEQQDKLAEAITQIHSEKFNAPRLLVNVIFKPTTDNAYVAGKRSKSNHVMAWLRSGPTRTKQDYDDVGEQITKAWGDIVGTDGDQQLRAVFLLGGLLSARESGILVPPPGGEGEWIAQNFADFQERARGGDQQFVDFVEELRTRECFKQFVPKTQ